MRISAELHSTGLLDDRLPSDTETALYRIAQEALTNVAKHSKAANVEIILERRANTTYTQAVEVAIIAKARGFRKLVVVTSPAHLRRAVPAFIAQGVDAVGSPAAFETERRLPRSRWRPTPIRC